MTRTTRISLISGGVAVVLLALTPFLIPVNQFRPVLERKASEALGRTVALGPLRLSVFGRSLSAETLAVSDDPAFSTSPFMTAKGVKVGVEILPLVLSRSLVVTAVTIEQPEVTLLRNAAGHWNYSSLRASAGPSSSGFTIGRLELIDGRMIVGSAASGTRSTYDHVDVTASEVSLASGVLVAATARLAGGGTFKLAGHVGPVNPADASLTPIDATVAVEGLDLAITGFLDPTLGLGGRLDLKATIASKGDRAEVGGLAMLSRALLVSGGTPASQPVVVEFTSTYDLHQQKGVLHSSTLKIAGATGRLSGTYDSRGEQTMVNLRFAGERMPATDLQSFLPALGIRLPKGATLSSGTLTANLAIAGATHRLVTTGTIGLYKARLAGFDLGTSVRTIAGLAGFDTGRNLDIESVTATLRITPDGVRFDRLNAVIPTLGVVTGLGTIDARNRLDFKMVAIVADHLSGTIGAVVGTSGAVSDIVGMLMGGDAHGKQSKTERVPFLVKGTTTDPEFIPDVSGLALQFIKEQLGIKP